MIIDCISDLHGYYPTQLGGGDLLIVAGDLTARDTLPEFLEFFKWFDLQNYTKKILIGGNHDNYITSCGVVENPKISYLLDSGTEFEGLKIWGAPWTLNFKGQNPHCKAFGLDTELLLAEKWAKIPDDTDILVTHSPPFGTLDRVQEQSGVKYCGSLTLKDRIKELEKLKYHVFGHIHESYGSVNVSYATTKVDSTVAFRKVQHVNCSYVDHDYMPNNQPIRINHTIEE